MKTQDLPITVEYHPPMTGLETHMEEEIAEETHAQFEPLEQAHRMGEASHREPSPESKEDRKFEELMHLAF